MFYEHEFWLESTAIDLLMPIFLFNTHKQTTDSFRQSTTTKKKHSTDEIIVEIQLKANM